MLNVAFSASALLFPLIIMVNVCWWQIREAQIPGKLMTRLLSHDRTECCLENPNFRPKVATVAHAQICESKSHKCLPIMACSRLHSRYECMGKCKEIDWGRLTSHHFTTIIVIFRMNKYYVYSTATHTVSSMPEIENAVASVMHLPALRIKKEGDGYLPPLRKIN